MKLSNLHTKTNIVLTFAENFFVGDIPINEETKFYDHIVQEGDQTVFTFSDVGSRLPAESKYVGGISARIYVKKIDDKKFQIAGVLFNLRKAWVWDLNDPAQQQKPLGGKISKEREQLLKQYLAQKLKEGTLTAGRPEKIDNIFSYVKSKLGKPKSDAEVTPETPESSPEQQDSPVQPGNSPSVADQLSDTPSELDPVQVEPHTAGQRNYEQEIDDVASPAATADVPVDDEPVDDKPVDSVPDDSVPDDETNGFWDDETPADDEQPVDEPADPVAMPSMAGQDDAKPDESSLSDKVDSATQQPDEFDDVPGYQKAGITGSLSEARKELLQRISDGEPIQVNLKEVNEVYDNSPWGSRLDEASSKKIALAPMPADGVEWLESIGYKPVVYLGIPLEKYYYYNKIIHNKIGFMSYSNISSPSHYSLVKDYRKNVRSEESYEQVDAHFPDLYSLQSYLHRTNRYTVPKPSEPEAPTPEPEAPTPEPPIEASAGDPVAMPSMAGLDDGGQETPSLSDKIDSAMQDPDEFSDIPEYQKDLRHKKGEGRFADITVSLSEVRDELERKISQGKAIDINLKSEIEVDDNTPNGKRLKEESGGQIQLSPMPSDGVEWLESVGYTPVNYLGIPLVNYYYGHERMHNNIGYGYSGGRAESSAARLRESPPRYFMIQPYNISTLLKRGNSAATRESVSNQFENLPALQSFLHRTHYVPNPPEAAAETPKSEPKSATQERAPKPPAPKPPAPKPPAPKPPAPKPPAAPEKPIKLDVESSDNKKQSFAEKAQNYITDLAKPDQAKLNNIIKDAKRQLDGSYQMPEPSGFANPSMKAVYMKGMKNINAWAKKNFGIEDDLVKHNAAEKRIKINFP